MMEKRLKMKRGQASTLGSDLDYLLRYKEDAVESQQGSVDRADVYECFTDQDGDINDLLGELDGLQQDDEDETDLEEEFEDALESNFEDDMEGSDDEETDVSGKGRRDSKPVHFLVRDDPIAEDDPDFAALPEMDSYDNSYSSQVCCNMAASGKITASQLQDHDHPSADAFISRKDAYGDNAIASGPQPSASDERRIDSSDSEFEDNDEPGQGWLLTSSIYADLNLSSCHEVYSSGPS